MIIVQLKGGLGNQMFQYALGRVISLKRQDLLYLDIRLLINSPKNITVRNFDLDKFDIKANIAPNNLLKHTPLSQRDIFWIFLQRMLGKELIINYFKEQDISFDPDVFNVSGNTYFEGYWQSEDYFKEIAPVIRNDFIFKIMPDKLNKEVLLRIKNTNSVSLHIRRGDYVSSPIASQVLGVLGKEYYNRALDLIKKWVKDPHIFIFSDDIKWARKNFNLNIPLYFVDINQDKKNYEDMRLMSNCQHHIIANSSFSWWGAWLGLNPNKIIIRPKKWFNQANMETKNLCPPSWIKV
jgi:hypothetical protein